MADDRSRSPLTATKEWHSRGYLPHWEAGETPQALSFRLADSLPRQLRELWQAELSSLPEEIRTLARRKRIEQALDAGHGEAFLARPDVAPLVESALLHFDDERYRLHAGCIMPNHVHVLATPLGEYSLSNLIHGWKSFTSRNINRAINRAGPVWFEEYFDRKIRNERHFENAKFYIEQNPVKASFCKHAEDWPFSSASSHARPQDA